MIVLDSVFMGFYWSKNKNGYILSVFTMPFFPHGVECFVNKIVYLDEMCKHFVVLGILVEKKLSSGHWSNEYFA